MSDLYSSFGQGVLARAAAKAIEDIERQLPGAIVDHWEVVEKMFRQQFAYKIFVASRSHHMSKAEILMKAKEMTVRKVPMDSVSTLDAELGLRQLFGPKYFQNPPTTK